MEYGFIYQLREKQCGLLDRTLTELGRSTINFMVGLHIKYQSSSLCVTVSVHTFFCLTCSDSKLRMHVLAGTGSTHSKTLILAAIE